VTQSRETELAEVQQKLEATNNTLSITVGSRDARIQELEKMLHAKEREVLVSLSLKCQNHYIGTSVVLFGAFFLLDVLLDVPRQVSVLLNSGKVYWTTLTKYVQMFVKYFEIFLMTGGQGFFRIL